MVAMDQCNNTRPFGWRLALWSLLIALPIIPFIAMQFTSEVVWDRFDFVVAAVLLASVGLTIELALQSIDRPFLRRFVIAAIVSVGIFIWLQGAIGLI